MNSVDPDQMQHSVASGLGLHCLPMSLLWEARHKWVKKKLLWGLIPDLFMGNLTLNSGAIPNYKHDRIGVLCLICETSL